jgi:hypothetical protein
MPEIGRAGAAARQSTERPRRSFAQALSDTGFPLSRE